MGKMLEVRTEIIVQDSDTGDRDEFTITREKTSWDGDPTELNELIQRVANSAQAQFDDLIELEVS